MATEWAYRIVEDLDTGTKYDPKFNTHKADDEAHARHAVKYISENDPVRVTLLKRTIPDWQEVE